MLDVRDLNKFISRTSYSWCDVPRCLRSSIANQYNVLSNRICARDELVQVAQSIYQIFDLSIVRLSIANMYYQIAYVREMNMFISRTLRSWDVLDDVRTSTKFTIYYTAISCSSLTRLDWSTNQGVLYRIFTYLIYSTDKYGLKPHPCDFNQIWPKITSSFDDVII